MKIGIIGPLWEQIPPPKYGGTELVVSQLVEGLVKKGEDVTLFAPASTTTSANLVSVVERPLMETSVSWTNLTYPLLNISQAFDRADEFDILHVHLNVVSDYLALPLAKELAHKVLFTLHFTAPKFKGYPDRQQVLEKYASYAYSSISNAQRHGLEELNWIKTIYNGINLSDFPYIATPKDYWLWVGKFNPDKGAHLAIAAAKKTGVKLLLAGKIEKLDEIDRVYYEEQIKPFIDGEQIEYVGEIGGAKKAQIFGEAKGFLNPIQWEEPFGLVMAESQAVGTPVISMSRGAAPEVVLDGKTGFLVDTIEEMVEKMKLIERIARHACREHVEEHFTNEKMVEGYLDAYSHVLGQES